MTRHGIRPFFRPNRSARKPIKGATTIPGTEPAAIKSPAKFYDSPRDLKISGVELTKIELCKSATVVTENTKTFDGSRLTSKSDFTYVLFFRQIWTQNQF